MSKIKFNQSNTEAIKEKINSAKAEVKSAITTWRDSIHDLKSKIKWDSNLNLLYVNEKNSANWQQHYKSCLNLLDQCTKGDSGEIKNLKIIIEKLDAVTSSLNEVQAKIDNFNIEYADLTEAAKSNNLADKMNATSNGSMVGFKTSITIDNESYDVSLSEAMNSFYTYSGSVISSRIEADYMEQTYGAEINYTDLVKNANGFMVKTIQSGLYTPEFVNGVLPNHIVSLDTAKTAVSGILEISTDKFESVLTKVMGTSSIGLGLVGATFIGNVGKSIVPNKPDNGDGGSGGGGTGGGGTGGGGTTPKPPAEEKNDEKELNDSEINTIKEFDEETLELIEKFEMPEIDYDEMARIEYEAKGEDAIAQERVLAITNANALFDNTDKTPLIMNLKSFGYSDSEIEVIITNRDYTITAFVEGSQRKTLTGIANQLATKDGVADFDTMYDDGQKLADLENGNSAQLTSIMSSDPKVSEAQTKMLDSQKGYKEAYEKMQQSYTDIQEDKKELDALKTEIVSKYGEDPKKWTKEDATKYNTAIDEYNKKFEQVKTEIEATKEAESTYQESVEEYDIAKATFFKQIVEEQQKRSQEAVTLGEPAVHGIAEQTQGAPATPQESVDQTQGATVPPQDGLGRPVTEEDLNGLVIGPDGIKFE